MKLIEKIWENLITLLIMLLLLVAVIGFIIAISSEFLTFVPIFEQYRYDSLRHSESYQSGLEDEIRQMNYEYQATTDCRQRNALTGLINAKIAELDYVPTDIEMKRIETCEN